MKFLLILPLIFILCSCSNVESVESGSDQMNSNTKLVDILNKPEFNEFKHLLISQEAHKLTDNDRIHDLQRFYIWHSHINDETTIDVLQSISDAVNQGDKIFYDIYTDEEKISDPRKNNTGLFFFRGKINSPFAIINAGGGFMYVGLLHESLPHALYLSRQGYNAFALQYRTGGAQVACEDLARAITFIFNHAEELGVSTENYSLWGGSAGARMSAYLGSYGPAAFNGDNLPRPNTVVMQYTGHSEYTENDPATYVCIGENDGIANWQTMKRRIDQLSSLGIPTEFHKYPRLEHGFGLGIGTSAEGWIDDAINFWQQNIIKF